MAVEIDLSGRVALVTGGSRGLGRADALTLARAGADVAIADILVESDTSAAEEYGVLAQAAVAQGMVHTEGTVQEIRGLGRRSLAVRCDVTDRPAVDAAVARVVEELGSIDILVNNAGTLDHVGQFPDQRLDLWERDLRVNLTGAFNCSQAVWPHMRERSWGRIVNMASVAGTLGGFGQASYSTTKSGILGLTRTLARLLLCHALLLGRAAREAAAHLAILAFEIGDHAGLRQRRHFCKVTLQRGHRSVRHHAGEFGRRGAEADALQQVARGGLVPFGGGQGLPGFVRGQGFGCLGHGRWLSDETLSCRFQKGS